jgi:hypothetical protein
MPTTQHPVVFLVFALIVIALSVQSIREARYYKHVVWTRLPTHRPGLNSTQLTAAVRSFGRESGRLVFTKAQQDDIEKILRALQRAGRAKCEDGFWYSPIDTERTAA